MLLDEGVLSGSSKSDPGINEEYDRSGANDSNSWLLDGLRLTTKSLLFELTECLEIAFPVTGNTGLPAKVAVGCVEPGYGCSAKDALEADTHFVFSESQTGTAAGGTAEGTRGKVRIAAACAIEFAVPLGFGALLASEGVE
jgi:hypothetical protein